MSTPQSVQKHYYMIRNDNQCWLFLFSIFIKDAYWKINWSEKLLSLGCVCKYSDYLFTEKNEATCTEIVVGKAERIVVIIY